jgi:hypothetical protein
MLATRRDHPLNAVFQALGCRNVADITYDLFVSNEIKAADQLHDLPRTDIGDLYEYFRYFGDFRIANALRILLLEKWVSEQMRMPHVWVSEQMRMPHVSPDGLNAALELGRPQLVIDLLSEKRVQLKDREHVREVKAMAHALLGDLATANKLWKQRFGSGDYLFYELINGRSIAVVGPAPPGEKIGAEIDSYDLVIRTNYRSGSNNPVNLYGTRTDIAYFNHHRISTYFDEVVNVASSLRWIILKSQNDEAKFRNLFPTYKGGVRTMFFANLLFFGTSTPMAIPNILSDLVRFSPRCIKLFCTTFYNSENTYSKSYRPISLGNNEISESLRIHELFSGFIFVQNLYRAGLCTVDHLTEEVLDLSREQYAVNINKLYGSLSCQ